MALDVDVPEMGESVSEVIVLEWLKSDGDYVDKDEPICVLETDKANVDLPAPAAGVLHPLQEVDATLEVGDVIARIEEGERPSDDGSAASAAPEPAAAPEPEPAPPEIQEPAAPAPAPEAPVPEAQAPEAPGADLSALSPAVRRLVEENDLDPSQIEGTGRGGRLIKQDITAYLKERERDARDGAAAPAPAEPAPATASPEPAAPKPEPVTAKQAPAPAPPAKEGERREPMSRIRKRIAQRLTEAQKVAAMLTTFNEVDLGEVMALRARHKEALGVSI
jgi:2-oxoglutarate dehydrogenase E2 component (dihydrolipoamide succinyltransferase)